MSATPYGEVRRALDGPRVAAELGLRPAREKHKHACVACDSSDALHVYRDGATCYSCGWSGSVIDLAALACRVEPAEACRMLAERFGIEPDLWYRRPSSSLRRTPVPDRVDDATTLRHRAEVYGEMLRSMTLGPAGRAYLARRGFEPEFASAWGIRSLDSETAWTEFRSWLSEGFAVEELQAAGFPSPWLPWKGEVPAIMIPYVGREGIAVEAVRFRRITEGPHRYMAPCGAGARIPWRAEAFDGPRPLELVVTEGELDALALVQAGWDAVALGGATPSSVVLECVVGACSDAAKVALWTDDDAAGDRAVDRLACLFAERRGWAWTEDHVVRWRNAYDPADLLARGQLT